MMLGTLQCPAWAKRKVDDYEIPLLSTSWLVQSLIEDQPCAYNDQACFSWDYVCPS